MCLSISKDVEEKVNAMFTDTDEIVCYKYYLVENYTLVSPFMRTKYVEPGTINSKINSKLTSSEISSCRVEHGIHVFINPNTTINDNYKSFNGHYAEVKVRCKKEHLRAAGYWNNTTSQSAVFSQIFIPDEEFYKHIQKVELSKLPLKENGIYHTNPYHYFPGGPITIIKITETSVRFKTQNDATWDCGKTCFLENLLVVKD